MRTFSFCEQSTRYCNFSSDKFNNEITFIQPNWLDENVSLSNSCLAGDEEYCTTEFYFQYYDRDGNLIKPSPSKIFIRNCQIAEQMYLHLIKEGCKPQEAREVLPLCTKTELVMTGTISQWEAFFKLRCDKAAHPMARELAIPLREEFIKRGYIK